MPRSPACPSLIGRELGCFRVPGHKVGAIPTQLRFPSLGKRRLPSVTVRDAAEPITRTRSKGFAQLEKIEPAKVGVSGVERGHPVLQEDCREVRVGNVVAASRRASDGFVDAEEALLFAEGTGLRQGEQASDIGEGFQWG